MLLARRAEIGHALQHPTDASNLLRTFPQRVLTQNVGIMPTVYIPASLRRMTDGTRTVEVTATTVRGVINELDRRFPGLKQRLCEGSDLKPDISVSVDSRISSQGLLEPVNADSEVHFISAVGGG